MAQTSPRATAVAHVDTRSSWKLDLKWIAGLLAALFVGAALLLFGLARVTAPTTAIDVMTTSTALLFSQNGLDDPTDIDQLRQQLAESPTGTLQPLPGQDITVRAADLTGKTPREIRLTIFKKLAQQIYNVDQRQGMLKGSSPAEQLGVLAFFTHPMHLRLVHWSWIAAAVALVFLGVLVWFSRRFGRLVSPGVVLLVMGLPFAAATLIVERSFVQQAAPPGQAETSAVIGYVGGYVGPAIMRALGSPYRWAVLVGLGLLLAALVARLLYGITHKHKSAKKAS
ncbi:MAG: hypothetical protein U0517_01475 [Candidatus Andersenbacteria bacterium]